LAAELRPDPLGGGVIALPRPPIAAIKWGRQLLRGGEGKIGERKAGRGETRGREGIGGGKEEKRGKGGDGRGLVPPHNLFA